MIPGVFFETYSYEEGILHVLRVVIATSIFALISMIVSLIIGIRKKDCIAILTGNIMVKTIAIFLCQILYDWLHLDIVFIVIVFFIATIIIEGFIYKKVLKYKKHRGITVSLICNTVTVIICFLIIYICPSRAWSGWTLWDLLRFLGMKK